MKAIQKMTAIILTASMLAASSAICVSAAEKTTVKINLGISKELHVANPAYDTSVSSSNYYITGTSDPDEELYLNGDLVEKRGKRGSFGVYVSLKNGKNTFTFEQDGEEVTRVIRKGTGGSSGGGSSGIDYITQNSMYPTVLTETEPGKKVTLSCIAPATAKVTATIGGKKVTLKQVATAQKGIPARFQAVYTIPSKNYPDDEVTKIGNVKYTMTYNGKSKAYTSTGSIFVVGEDTENVAAEVVGKSANVYVKATTNSACQNVLRVGTKDYIVDREGNFVKLSSGGWVDKGLITLLEGKVKLTNNAKTYSTKKTNKREYFILEGVENMPYKVSVKDGAIVFEIYNIQTAPKLKMKSSQLFSSIDTEKTTNKVVYTMHLKEGVKAWGYDINFEDGNTVLYVHKKPVIDAESDTPLDGVNIVVDAGHGGVDPGALSTAGKYGPTEADLNLALAYKVKAQLEELGAKVYMTRKTDTQVLIQQVCDYTDRMKPDLFICLHHNSMGYTMDLTTVKGTEVYYHTPQSKVYAQNIVNSIASATGRTNRGVKYNDFRVDRQTGMPAILVENGFICNPYEYDELATSANMVKTAKGIGNGIVNTLR